MNGSVVWSYPGFQGISTANRSSVSRNLPTREKIGVSNNAMNLDHYKPLSFVLIFRGSAQEFVMLPDSNILSALIFAGFFLQNNHMFPECFDWNDAFP